MNIPLAEINLTDITALDAKNSSEVGIYIPNQQTAIQVMDELSESIGAYYGFNSDGIFRVGRLESPSGIASVILVEDSILEIDKVASNDSDGGIPAYRVEVQYAKNYTLQDRSNLAAAVADERVAELGVEYRTVISEDLTVLNKHELSPEIQKITLLITQVAAQAEALRVLNIYKVRRDVFNLRVRLDSQIITQLAIGALVELSYYRYGLQMGKLFTIIGLEVDYQSNKAEITLWG